MKEPKITREICKIISAQLEVVSREKGDNYVEACDYLKNELVQSISQPWYQFLLNLIHTEENEDFDDKQYIYSPEFLQTTCDRLKIHRNEKEYINWLSKTLKLRVKYNKKRLFHKFLEDYEHFKFAGLSQHSFTKWIIDFSYCQKWSVTTTRSSGKDYIIFDRDEHKPL